MPYFPQNNRDFNYLRHLMLLYGNAKTPWTTDDLKYYVAHCNRENREDDWLYDSFLFLNIKAASGNDYCADVNLGTSMSGEGDFFSMVSPHPANRSDWEALLDFYLGEQGSIQTLDATLAEAQQHIAVPYGTKRNVVLMLPYPHLTQESFGEVEGENCDFSIKNQNLVQATERRLKAEQWFVDEIVKRFNRQKCAHLHLLGVYWMHETVYRGWSVDDHWLLKELRRHIHSYGLKFLWIPFWSSYNIHLLDNYRDYYFDLAFLQPNFMFYENIKNVASAARAACTRNAGIEMEYYLELNEPIKIHDERHSRFRDYLNGGITHGYMTNAVCAHFQGVGSLQRMHAHAEPIEREFYDDIYHFVKGDYSLKPAIPRSTQLTRDVVLAVDLGGTNLRAAIVDEMGNIIHRKSIGTPKTKDEIILQMVSLLSELKCDATKPCHTLRGIGVSTGGRVDWGNGIIIESTALLSEWQNVPLRTVLQDAFKLPVWVDNDGNCAALAEQMFGLGRDVSNVVVLVLGTGIGGGVVVNGQLLRYEKNGAAELGHVSIDYNGPQCSCGNRGCVELYASGSGLARLAQELITSGSMQLADISASEVTAQVIGNAARQGNKDAQQLVEQAGRSVGFAVSTLVNTLNPERVILSGSLMQLGDVFVKSIREVVHDRAMKTARESVAIVVSELNDSPLLGAAAMVFDHSDAVSEP